MPLLSHLWTAVPRLRHALRPATAPEAQAWEAWLDDPQVGRVRLNGRLRVEGNPEEALLVVHGLGGCIDSHYMGRIARAAE